MAHQRDELAHVGLLLVADVGEHGLRGRVVGGQVVGLVQVDGLELAGDVKAQRLHELGVGHLAVDVAGERVGETGHGSLSFYVPPGGAARIVVIEARDAGGGSSDLSARYHTPFVNDVPTA